MKLFLRVLALVLLIVVAVMSLNRRPDSAWITYVSAETGLHLMSADGQGDRQLLDSSACPHLPRFSPDGAWIGYVDFCTTQFSFVALDGHRTRPSFDAPPDIIDWVWSPDGESMLATWVTEVDYALSRVSADEMTVVMGGGFGVVYAPNDEWLYAYPYYAGDGSLSRLPTRSGQVAEVLFDDPFITQPDWSLDGARMVIGLSTDTGVELFIMEYPDGELTPLTVDAPPPSLFAPRWSPDGEWIAFLGGESYGGTEVYRIHADGRDLEQLWTDEAVESLRDAVWTPDGEWLVMLLNGFGEDHIFRLRPNDPTPQVLAAGRDPHLARASGRDLRPLPLVIASLGMLAVSLIGGRRR